MVLAGSPVAQRTPPLMLSECNVMSTEIQLRCMSLDLDKCICNRYLHVIVALCCVHTCGVPCLIQVLALCSRSDTTVQGMFESLSALMYAGMSDSCCHVCELTEADNHPVRPRSRTRACVATCKHTLNRITPIHGTQYACLQRFFVAHTCAHVLSKACACAQSIHAIFHVSLCESLKP
jgi:hypothetical protein